MNVPSSAAADFPLRISPLVEAGSWKEIAAACETVKPGEEGFAEAAFLSSVAAFQRDDFITAIEKGERAFGSRPNVSEFAGWLAALYVLVGNFSKSIFYAKMAGAVPSDSRIKGWMPASLPTFAESFPNIEELPLFQKAVTALAWNRWNEAEEWFRQHVAFAPHHRDGYLGLARCQMAQGRFQRAVQSLRAAMHLLPDDAEIASQLGQALAAVGRFEESRAVGRWACSLEPGSAEIAAAALRGQLADPRRRAPSLAGEYRRWGETFGARVGAFGPTPKPRRKPRLTVGYLLGGIGQRSEGPALAAILAHRDSQHFRAVGFAVGLLTHPNNIIFQKAMDAWHDVRDTDVYTLASMVAAEDVDILVDLSGFSMPSQLAGLGGRMAPLQVIWRGAPLGTGMASVDALLTDGVLDPEGAMPPFTEPLLRLGMGAVLAELPPDDRPMAPGTAEDRPLTFVADASQAELTPDTVEAWARILHDVPESILLLRDHDFRDPANAERLVELFGTFGLAHRVDVVESSPVSEFFAQADICLLPLHSDRPDVAIDALWAGIPVVGLQGAGRQWRETASLLTHMGLAAETLAPDVGRYRGMAMAWAGDDSRRAAFRDGIRARMEASPLFDAAARAADLEKTLTALWEQACD